MTCPGNGIYVVQGEMAIILTAMRREARWSSHVHQDEDQDPLIRSFSHLKDTLNQIDDLFELDPNTYLGPFLEVIRSIKTTGPVTSLALSSVNKFLSYGLIDNKGKSVAAAVENIASAVTRAKFVGTDQASDGVVLMKILQVLRTLMLSPEGAMLTNEIVCEIMKSCFRLCFETRLSELLRRTAEHCLKDMVQLLFMRLPQFSEDFRVPINLKKLKMRTENIHTNRTKRKSRMSARSKLNRVAPKVEEHHNEGNERETLVSDKQPGEGAVSPAERSQLHAPHLATTPMTPAGNIVDMQGTIHQETPESSNTDAATPTTAPPTSTLKDALSLEANAGNVLSEATSDTCDSSSKAVEVTSPEVDSSNLSSCVVINVEMESSCGGESPGLCSKTCSVEDISLSSPVEDEKHFPEEEVIEKEPEEHSVNEVTHTRETAEVTEDAELSKAEEEGCPEDMDISQMESPVTRPESEPPESVQESSIAEDEMQSKEYVNPRGVRFTSEDRKGDGSQPLVPYGVVCVRELFQFLISLCNPLDKQNNETMVHLGLTLLTVALEVGADSIGKFNSLLGLVKDDLCRNLFSLLNSERLSIFAADLQVCFLLFESLRTHLKFQVETYLMKLIDIIISDSPKIPYEQKEIALESVVQLWRIPGLVTELYLNYDCDLYCPNLFEDLTKLLSKNAFPVTGLYNTHLLSLDALLTIIDSIEAHCHSRILSERQEGKSDESKADAKGNISLSFVSLKRSARQKISEDIPNHEQLMAIKRKKKLLSTGTEQFNSKPKKGIQFLQEHGLLSTPIEPSEVVHFLRENPRLDKKMIGEYISSRSNLEVLDCFVKSFDFTDTRIDEALRLYLETFRLPGESPLISLIMEHFAEHWHKCNGEPLANADTAFTLAYAVIMLNVDQHNYNVKRQNIPMTIEEFKKNLKNVNGGEDFDQEMLDDIYHSIKNEEIVMPAEQTGIVRENYLWKVLLRRGAGRDGMFIHAPNGLFDHDLFSLIWGPTVAALSFVFDKSSDATIYQKAISGFRKCAMISAHYSMSNDFDNLVISLCKFTSLLNSAESPDNLTISFGANPKAQLAAKTVFTLAHRHGDILREGWKNVLDCLLQLYRCKLLPKALVEAEDFIEQNGKISLLREETPSQKIETGLLSSIYSYIALASETSNQKVPSAEDQMHIQQAQTCVRECHLEQLITESKFLRLDSLRELVSALILASHGPDGHSSVSLSYDEDVAVFFLELLLKVVIQNRDRVSDIWQSVQNHIYALMMGAAACDYLFLLERVVVGLLRLAIRLMRREDMSAVVLQSLRMLLLLKPTILFRVSRQISYGLYELLKTSAANIHSDTDWSIIFSLLECVGAGALPPRVVVGDCGKSSIENTTKSDGEVNREEDSGLGNDRGYTSDSELSRTTISPRPMSPEHSPNTGGGWILVGREGEIQPVQVRPLPINQFSIVLERELLAHDTYGLVKCCESLAFLIRDVAHITPYNFENCIHCIRTFVEASLNGTNKPVLRKTPGSPKETKQRKKSTGRKKDGRSSPPQRSRSPRDPNPYDADESDSEELPSGYHQVSIQLLDLMHTLHTRTAQIFRWWAEESGDPDFTSLWARGWCPLLQGIARLCCDSRKQVRTSAVTYLQRALLVHDLQTLSAVEWEGCFNKVLFPLLGKLLEPLSPSDPLGLEETRMRAATVLCKVFLHHLTPLQSLHTFTALWLTILDFMDKYMHADKSDLLYEAIPESLKNMLLVMDSAAVFSTSDGYTPLWTVTWDRIHGFLPGLQDELFKSHPAESSTRQLTHPEERPSGDTSPPLPVPSVEAVYSSSPPGAPVSFSPVPVPVLAAEAVTPESNFMPPPSISPPTSFVPSPAASPPPPSVNRVHPMPVFTHLGQQMISTAIGAPIASTTVVPTQVDAVRSSLLSEHSHNPMIPLFVSPVNCSPSSAIPSYSTYPVQASGSPPAVQDAMSGPRIFPAHYFYSDPQHAGCQQVFPVSVPAPQTIAVSSPPIPNPSHLFFSSGVATSSAVPPMPVMSSTPPEQTYHGSP